MGRNLKMSHISASAIALLATSTLVIQVGEHFRRTRRPIVPPTLLTSALVRSPAPDNRSGSQASPAASPLSRAIADDAPLPVELDAAAAPTSPESVPAATQRVVQGRMEDILYAPPGTQRLSSELAGQTLRLFAHKLDLTRDLALGDWVRLVLGDDGRLDYAELNGARVAIRLYRVSDTGEDADAFVDETGASLRRLLLRTPIAHPRPTSGFGLRLHPLLGYTRMHRGVDFGAAIGTPVMAAGDGVVEAMRWASGYGRWLKLRHAGGYETAYAHLSAWAPGLAPGTTVRQGQVIGRSGDSGLVTGPHLHFEVLREGQPIDPATATPVATVLSASQRAVLDQRRRAIDATLAAADQASASARTDGGR